jgi:hypothetical protein
LSSAYLAAAMDSVLRAVMTGLSFPALRRIALSLHPLSVSAKQIKCQ